MTHLPNDTHDHRLGAAGAAHPTRRGFVLGLAGLGAAAATRSTRSTPARPTPVRAVLFDAFVVFDPRPLAALAEATFPGRGAELTTSWRTRQFEYAWLHVLAHDYADFWRCTEDALVYAASALRLDLTAERRARLLAGYGSLRAWPDVPPALDALRAAGLELGLLSNFSPRMLDTAVGSAGLRGAFRHVLSTDAARTYKPDPRAYQLGVDATRLSRDEVVFAAFAGWDAAGAARFGYPSFWVNRLAAPPEALGADPAAAGATLADLVAFVRGRA